MVLTKKSSALASVQPSMVSRTNSYQALRPHALAHSSPSGSTLKANGTPLKTSPLKSAANSDASPRTLSHSDLGELTNTPPAPSAAPAKKSKRTRKNKRKNSPSPSSSALVLETSHTHSSRLPTLSHLLLAILLFFAVYAKFVCPSEEDAVCRNLARARDTLEPYAQTYVYPRIENARHFAEPYWNEHVAPRVEKITAHPIAQEALRECAMLAAYNAQFREKLGDGVQRFRKEWHPFYEARIHPVVKPLVKRTHVALIRAKLHVQHYARQKGWIGTDEGYVEKVANFWKENWMLYVEPHLERMRARLD